jgi:hypothetical protein
MKISSTFVFAVSIFSLAGCAHQTAVTTPVGVTVSSATASKRLVNDIRNATLTAIHDQVPNAHPMAVAIDLDVRNEASTTTHFAPAAASTMPVAAYGPDSTPNGYLPTVTTYGSSEVMERNDPTDIVMSYAIRNAAGGLLESQIVRLPGYTGRNPFRAWSSYVNEAAGFLASRVKALSR